jgi:hypothetical protein
VTDSSRFSSLWLDALFVRSPVPRFKERQGEDRNCWALAERKHTGWTVSQFWKCGELLSKIGRTSHFRNLHRKILVEMRGRFGEKVTKVILLMETCPICLETQPSDTKMRTKQGGGSPTGMVLISPSSMEHCLRQRADEFRSWSSA